MRRSPISKPSRSLTLTNASVPAPFTVNGRTTLENGPTAPTSRCSRASAIDSVADLRPARYTNRPSADAIVLCEPERVSIVSSTSPFSASTTCHAGPSNCGTNSVFPSGEIASRSVPPSYARSQIFAPLTASMAITRVSDVT